MFKKPNRCQIFICVVFPGSPLIWGVSNKSQGSFYPALHSYENSFVWDSLQKDNTSKMFLTSFIRLALIVVNNYRECLFFNRIRIATLGSCLHIKKFLYYMGLGQKQRRNRKDARDRCVRLVWPILEHL